MAIADKVKKYLSETGSTWMPVSVNTDISDELARGELVFREKRNNYYVTLPKYNETEWFCARNLLARMYQSIEVDEVQVKSLISDYEKQQTESIRKPFAFSDEQKEGILTICKNQIAILTGGPGTGKTSVLQCATYCLRRTAGKYLSIYFTAPTGKAAKRISESTGFKATTIQKFTGGIAGVPLKIKAPHIVFCDEFSMTDLDTLNNMLRALMPNTRIFLVGDVEQLPSVGIGAVLRDLIDCGLIPTVQLIKTFRQDNSSKLFENIQIIKDGCPIPLVEGEDFKCIRTEKDILDNTIREYLAGVEKYGLDNTVVLTAYRKVGLVCSETLNNKLQSILNPKENGKRFYRTKVQRENGRWVPIIFKEGDPVIQLVNNRMVANGDVGKVIKIDGSEVTVEFSDCVLKYHGKKLNELDLAYALSVHRSQGSEYLCVVLPVLRENKSLDRNLIYTGISRAKKYCVVLGEDEVIQNACKKQSSWERYSFLCDDLEIEKRSIELKIELLNNN